MIRSDQPPISCPRRLAEDPEDLSDADVQALRDAGVMVDQIQQNDDDEAGQMQEDEENDNIDEAAATDLTPEELEQLASQGLPVSFKKRKVSHEDLSGTTPASAIPAYVPLGRMDSSSSMAVNVGETEDRDIGSIHEEDVQADYDSEKEGEEITPDLTDTPNSEETGKPENINLPTHAPLGRMDSASSMAVNVGEAEDRDLESVHEEGIQVENDSEDEGYEAPSDLTHRPISVDTSKPDHRSLPPHTPLGRIDSASSMAVNVGETEDRDLESVHEDAGQAEYNSDGSEDEESNDSWWG